MRISAWIFIGAVACIPVCRAADDPAPARPPVARGGPLNPKDAPAVTLLFKSWNLPTPARTLIGNIHYVGAAGVSSFLITTPQGHVLIDTGFEQTVPQIRKGVVDLGFRNEDIKYILSSHAHVDHVGGHAEMKRITGAKIIASAADGHVMETGGADDFSPFVPELMRYTPVRPDRIVADGDTVSVGGCMLTACLTPAHTRGATSWTMDVLDHGRPLHVVFFSSITIVDGTSLLATRGYPEMAADFAATFVKLRAMPCDVFFAPHGGQFAMNEKFARLANHADPNPFIDPQGWKRLIGEAESAYKRQLARETANAR